ncbi:MAG: hypothetical protein J7L66_01565, partial [Anaerolineaceae bacterium]|nr:hypothetical protein [Anaerolineaceae bacterium]
KKRGNFKLQQKFIGEEKVEDHTDLEVEHHKKALLDAGYSVEIIAWDSNFIDHVRKANIDLVFNISSLVEAAILEELNIPFVGSDSTGIVLATDKSLAKRLWQQAGIPTSDFVLLSSMDDCQSFLSKPNLPYPLFIKPVAGRGSAGITAESYIQTGKQLSKNVEILLSTIGQPVLVEKYLEGREITIGLIGNGKHVRTLPPLERKYKEGENFLTFNKKEMDSDLFICPAKIGKARLKELQDFAVRAFITLGLKDYTRIDTKLTPEGFFLLEANSFAGLMCTPKEKPLSYIGFMARAEGIGGTELIREIIDVCLERINH